MSAAPAYRLGHHPRRTDHPALLHADGTVAATFAYNATREHIITSLEHAGLVLHADDTVEPDGERPKEGGEIAAAFAAGKVLSDAQDAFALGRQLAAAQMAYDAFDAASLAQGGGGDRDDGLNARSILNDRIEALRTLISTTPAKSLKDAAVLVAESLTVAGRLAGCKSNLHMAEKYSDRLERMLMSALPFVAEAARLDLAAMDWLEQDNLRAVLFSGVGVQQ